MIIFGLGTQFQELKSKMCVSAYRYTLSIYPLQFTVPFQIFLFIHSLPRFTVAVATDMSETERMKAERAAKIALEEERIKLEKERDSTVGM